MIKVYDRDCLGFDFILHASLNIQKDVNTSHAEQRIVSRHDFCYVTDLF